MATVLLVIHLMIATTLVCVVLLQKSEGGALGIGGGGGGGFLTGRGTANLLTRTTAALAAAFFLTSILSDTCWPAYRPRIGLGVRYREAAGASERTGRPGESATKAPEGRGGILDKLQQRRATGRSSEPIACCPHICARSRGRALTEANGPLPISLRIYSSLKQGLVAGGIRHGRAHWRRVFGRQEREPSVARANASLAVVAVTALLGACGANMGDLSTSSIASYQPASLFSPNNGYSVSATPTAAFT